VGCCTLPEDSQVSIGFSANGFLNQDVQIVAFDFGVEDSVLEDVYTVMFYCVGRLLRGFISSPKLSERCISGEPIFRFSRRYTLHRG
jgi:hypothetical protein